MLEIQAVIGRIQLRRMSEWTKKRQHYATLLDEAAKEFSVLRRVQVPEGSEHAEYKHYFFVNQEFLAEGWSRDRIIEEMNQLGVPCYQGSCSEVYLEKAFDNTLWRPQVRLPNAKQLGDTSIMMLVHPTLTVEEIALSVSVLKSVLSQAQK